MENLVNGCVFCLKYSKGLLFVHSTNQKKFCKYRGSYKKWVKNEYGGTENSNLA